MELQKPTNIFFNVIYLVNMLLAFIALSLFYLNIKAKRSRYNPLPKGLRLYLLTCSIPYSLLTCVASIFLSIIYFLQFNEILIVVKITKLILAFCTQQVRGSLLILITERTIATIILEKYTGYPSAGIFVFFVLTVFCYGLTFLYIIPSYAWIFVSSMKNVYFCLVYVVIFVHILTLIVGKILQTRNRRLYQLLAYRTTLKRRCQILENIKVLTFIFSEIFIYATVAPIGLIATLTHNLITGNAAPPSLFLITYNLSFILIILKELKISFKFRHSIAPEDEGEKNENQEEQLNSTILNVERRIKEKQPIKSVMSPLGRTLPTVMTSETYFKSLKQQWK